MQLRFAGELWKTTYLDRDTIIWEGNGGTWVRLPIAAADAARGRHASPQHHRTRGYGDDDGSHQQPAQDRQQRHHVGDHQRRRRRSRSSSEHLRKADTLKASGRAESSGKTSATETPRNEAESSETKLCSASPHMSLPPPPSLLMAPALPLSLTPSWPTPCGWASWQPVTSASSSTAPLHAAPSQHRSLSAGPTLPQPPGLSLGGLPPPPPVSHGGLLAQGAMQPSQWLGLATPPPPLNGFPGPQRSMLADGFWPDPGAVQVSPTSPEHVAHLEAQVEHLARTVASLQNEMWKVQGPRARSEPPEHTRAYMLAKQGPPRQKYSAIARAKLKDWHRFSNDGTCCLRPCDGAVQRPVLAKRPWDCTDQFVC